MLPAFKKVPAPPGYVDRYRYNTPLIVAGGVTLGLTYVASIARGAKFGFKDGRGALFVPILGPWLTIAGRTIDCDVSVDTGGSIGDIDEDIDESTDEATKCFANEAASIAVLTGMGIGQLIGATLLAAGIIDRRHYYLRADLASMKVEPWIDGQNLGLSVRGTF